MLLQFKITVFYFNTLKNAMHFIVNHENFYVRLYNEEFFFYKYFNFSNGNMCNIVNVFTVNKMYWLQTFWMVVHINIFVTFRVVYFTNVLWTLAMNSLFINLNV